MVTKLTRLSHRIAIHLHLMADSCIIYGSRSRKPVRKLLYKPSYVPVSPVIFIIYCSWCLYSLSYPYVV